MIPLPDDTKFLKDYKIQVKIKEDPGDGEIGLFVGTDIDNPTSDYTYLRVYQSKDPATVWLWGCTDEPLEFNADMCFERGFWTFLIKNRRFRIRCGETLLQFGYVNSTSLATCTSLWKDKDWRFFRFDGDLISTHYRFVLLGADDEDADDETDTIGRYIQYHCQYQIIW